LQLTCLNAAFNCFIKITANTVNIDKAAA